MYEKIIYLKILVFILFLNCSNFVLDISIKICYISIDVLMEVFVMLLKLLNKKLSEGSNADSDDVKNVKEGLFRLGYYKPVSGVETSSSFSPYPNMQLFNGIEAFQRDNNLLVDRVMTPDGETEHSLLSQIVGTGKSFLSNYFDMREANTVGADKYFHSKANCESAQLGDVGELLSRSVSLGREVFDVPSNLLLKKMSWREVMDDWRNDDAANIYGRVLGESYKNADCSDLVKKYRPSVLKKEFW